MAFGQLMAEANRLQELMMQAWIESRYLRLIAHPIGYLVQILGLRQVTLFSPLITGWQYLMVRGGFELMALGTLAVMN